MTEKNINKNNQQQNKNNNKIERRGFGHRGNFDVLREHDNSSLHSILSQLEDSKSKKQK